jgi:hypothetical protein
MFTQIEQVAGLLMMLAGALVVAALMSGCTPRPYEVCGPLRCTAPMTEQQAVSAASVDKAWGEKSDLRVGVAPR